MKLKSLALGAVVAASLSASAASTYLFDNPDNIAHFGARVSVDISSAANGGGFYSNQAGFSVGGIYNIPLFMNLYFEPGLSVFYNTIGANQWDTFTQKVPQLDGAGQPVVGPGGEAVTDDVEVPYQIDGSIRNFGFRIPLNVGYHFDFTEDVKVHVFTGPQINLSLVARYHQDAVRVPGVEEPSYSTSLFGTNGFKHVDLQWNFGAGVEYQKYYMSLSGAWGITKMKSGTIDLQRNLRRNIFAITLGYNF